LKRPELENLPVLLEEAQGNYSYEDSSSSYSGRFILFSYENLLAIDLYAAYFSAASIRYSPDSTLLYLPMNGELLIMNRQDELPLEGWEIPISPLASGYLGKIPPLSDSAKWLGDSFVIYKNKLSYYQNKKKELVKIKAMDWELIRSGSLAKIANRAKHILFKKGKAQLILDFTDLAIKKLDPSLIFTLTPPEGTKIIDYR